MFLWTLSRDSFSCVVALNKSCVTSYRILGDFADCSVPSAHKALAVWYVKYVFWSPHLLSSPVFLIKLPFATMLLLLPTQLPFSAIPLSISKSNRSPITWFVMPSLLLTFYFSSFYYNLTHLFACFFVLPFLDLFAFKLVHLLLVSCLPGLQQWFYQQFQCTFYF